MTKLATARIVCGGVTFEMELPAKWPTSDPAGRPYFSLEDLRKLEVGAAKYIIEHAIATPDTIRLFRSVAGLTLGAFEALLGGANMADPAALDRPSFLALWSTMAALALDAMEGRTETADRLRAAQAPHEPTGEIVKLASS